ncbi:BolA-like protein 3 [Coemansia sp. RSA 552]|nr:BolA-like protein 3 [Coemansia sp. RSA 552]
MDSLEKRIHAKLAARFPKAERLGLINNSADGCGAMFEVILVSDELEGLSRIKRHRLINDTLKEEMGEIHALQLRQLYTAAEYKAKQEKLLAEGANKEASARAD